MAIVRVGVDLAKHVFAIHGIDDADKSVEQRAWLTTQRMRQGIPRQADSPTALVVRLRFSAMPFPHSAATSCPFGF